MADPAGPAVRPGILGSLLVGIVAVLTAGLLFLPLMLFGLGVLAALATWFPALGDPTWNDGDAGLGLGIGGPALLAVLAVAVGVFMALARRFRLPVRRWVFGGVAGSLLLAAAALWVAF